MCSLNSEIRPIARNETRRRHKLNAIKLALIVSHTVYVEALSIPCVSASEGQSWNYVDYFERTDDLQRTLETMSSQPFVILASAPMIYSWLLMLYNLFTFLLTCTFVRTSIADRSVHYVILNLQFSLSEKWLLQLNWPSVKGKLNQDWI